MKHIVLTALLFSNYTLGATSEFIISQHQDINELSALQPCIEKVKIAYDTLNIAYKIVQYPGRRSILMADTGHSDADLCRVKLIENRYKNLYRVEPAIHQLAFYIITKKPHKPINSLNMLKSLKLGSIRGMMAAELMFEHHDIRYENTLKQAARLLKNNTVDVLILPLHDIDRLMMDDSTTNFHVQEKPLYQLKLYHYIHKKHKDMAIPLSTIFKHLTSINKAK
ncbi:hypothetical protein [Thalassotalea sp. G2M2-11]|uniref:hypothetical protein n=1 Tax=Thalassotalea sp. G2M2-11 TaxID=2787627 RepID=UPI0019D05318|nr:hypothetical protein [Thalassotalea sp. G2M2-11]